jgi:hypothetical protein
MTSDILFTIKNNAENVTDKGLNLPFSVIPGGLTDVTKLVTLYSDLAKVNVTRKTSLSQFSEDQKAFLTMVQALPSRCYSGSMIEPLVNFFKRLKRTEPADINHALSLLDDVIVILSSETSKERYVKWLEGMKEDLIAENERVPLIPLVQLMEESADKFSAVANEKDDVYEKTEKRIYRNMKESGRGLVWPLFWRTVQQMHLIHSTVDDTEMKEDMRAYYTSKDFQTVKKRLQFLQLQLTKLFTSSVEKKPEVS